jgi:hypothetical protein
MNPHSKNHQNSPLSKNEGFDLHKALDCFQYVLSMDRTKKGTPKHIDGTIDKEISTILAQMSTNNSADLARSWLELIGRLIFLFAQDLSESEVTCFTKIESFISIFKPDKGASLFSVSSGTLNSTLEKYPKKDADDILTAQLTNIQQSLRKQGLWSRELAIAIDPTNIISRSKFHNQYTPIAYVGGKSTCKNSHKEVMFYVNPGAFIEASANFKVIIAARDERDIALWLQQGQNVVKMEKERGNHVGLFEGDREHFAAVPFGFSFFGLWNSTISLKENPRFLCPKKIWGDSTEIKWSYLSDPNAPILEKDSISLEYYQEKFFGTNLTRLSKNEKNANYLIPVTSVAVFDAYPNRHHRETMEWAHKEAQHIESQILILTPQWKSKDEEYRKYMISKQNEKEQKHRKKNSKHKQEKDKKKASKTPKEIGTIVYTGKRRTHFKDPIEKKMYQECCNSYDRLQRWIKKKNQLCNRLMFFMLSLYEGETIEGKDKEFTQFVQYYHERWSIENGVKTVKHCFMVKTNDRGTCARHVRWILGCLMYNAWHYWRLTRAARILKKDDPDWKPFVKKETLSIRKKYERKIHPILTAQGYILEELERSLKFQLKKVLAMMG